MNTDPIADFLTRIRNACTVSHPHVDIPSSKFKVELAKLLQKEGYIQRYDLRENAEQKMTMIRLFLKYDPEGFPVIRHIQRYSRPGLRRYFRVNRVPRVLNGAGIGVLTTSKGLLTDREARKERLGGELVCTVY